MKYKPFILSLFYCFFLLIGRVYGVSEKILTLGASSSWDLVEKRLGITERSRIRPNPVLVLSGTADPRNEDFLDLYLSFDEAGPESFRDSKGRYTVFSSPQLAVAVPPLTRAGTGAALFSGKTSSEPLTIKPRSGALFAPGGNARDFSIEFWIYPQNVEEGEQVLSWNSSMPDKQNGFYNQRIQCSISKSMLQWNFRDFFFSPDGNSRKALGFSGPLLLPGRWSHHLVRFDADLGLLEYLVDGKVEVIEYITGTGREGADVYVPVIGNNGSFVLGSRFSGMMDEFRVYRCCLETPNLSKYPSIGGRAESRTLDLGFVNSRVLRIEAFGGRTFNRPAESPRAGNEYAGNGVLRFPDHAELRFFLRASNSPYRWNDVPWIPVEPGTELPEFPGRYVQIAADFYPGMDGNTSPYLAELRVVYSAAEPPPPPAHLTAIAKDGAVELAWRASSSRDVGGYLIYYGTASGEYFGDHAVFLAAEAKSPINTGNRASVRIEGLKNGTLYYFAVAAYNKTASGMALPEPGEFSREAVARPLRMVE